MSDEENPENSTGGRRCTSVDLKLCISPCCERLGDRYLASPLCQTVCYWSPCLLETKIECPYLKHQIGICQKPCDLHRKTFVLASRGLSSYPAAVNLLCALEKMTYLSLLSCSAIFGSILTEGCLGEELWLWSKDWLSGPCKYKTLCWSLWISGATRFQPMVPSPISSCPG